MQETAVQETPVPGTTITVEGRFEHHHAAERGTVSLVVGFEGPQREDVMQRATHAHARIVDQVRALHDPSSGPVTWWSAQRMSVWSRRPWNDHGKQLPFVHHAQVGLEAKFSDLARLAEWVEQVAVLDGVTVRGVDWTLTEVTRTRRVADARARAVADAVERAGAYASALGLTDVRAVALAEPGMLGDQRRPAAPEAVAMMRGAVADGAGGQLDLKPEDITVESAVHARFVAS